jgi:hypothetical protein
VLDLNKRSVIFISVKIIMWNSKGTVKGNWRKLHNKGIHSFYCSSNQFGDKIKENEMDGACSKYG